jgi:hypothetical protein
MTGIHESLAILATPVKSLVPLLGNPRRGDVDAIMASYAEFGQLKPIVARKLDDGTAIVVAGNHQLEAVKRLGWEQIACVFIDGDERRSRAFAIADNRTTDLGSTDDAALAEMLLGVGEEYSELMLNLGWDEFEMAAIEEMSSVEDSDVATSSAFVPPVVEQEGNRSEGKVTDEKLAAIGSTAITGAKKPGAIVQYTIVFDGVEQQSRWYAFIKWLRNDPSIDGNTTSERLINFLNAHCDY